MTTRRTTARLSDLRLWTGVALVVVAMAVGAFVMRPGGDTVTVLRATRDLPAGAAPADLDRVQVQRSLVGGAYLAAEDPAGGAGDAVLRWPVRAGELVPRGALAEPTAAQVRHVTLAVEPLHAPAALNPGDRVDVWASAGTSSSDRSAPELVLPAAAVRSVGAETGVGGELGVVLDVPVHDVGDVVAAARGGVIDLVAVPLDAVPQKAVPSTGPSPDGAPGTEPVAAAAP